MKRSEMEEHIQAMMEDSVKNRQYSGETDEKYYKRHAKYILEMLLGFGMLPPEAGFYRTEKVPVYAGPSDIYLYDQEVKVWIQGNKWEPEDE